jgi:hypothetical protein
VAAIAPTQETAPKALKEAEEVKGSYRKLVIALAVLLVVAAAGSVLYAQAMAGTGVGFSVMKTLADTGGSDSTFMAGRGARGRGGFDLSCATGDGGCGGAEGGSSCSMSKPDGASAEGDSCSTATPKVEADEAAEADAPDTE